MSIEYWMITERRQTRHVMDHVITGMEMVLGSLLSPPSLRKLRDFFQVIVTMNMFIELNDISPLAVAVPSFCLDIWKTADTFGVKLPLAVVIYAVRAVFLLREQYWLCLGRPLSVTTSGAISASLSVLKMLVVVPSHARTLTYLP